MDFKKFIRNRCNLNEKYEQDIHKIVRQITQVDDTAYGYKNKMGRSASIILRNLGVALRDFNIDVQTTKMIRIPLREVSRLRNSAFKKTRKFNPKSFVELLKIEMQKYNTAAMIIVANESFETNEFTSSDEIYVLAKRNRLINDETDQNLDVTTLLQISKDSDDYRELKGTNRRGVYRIITMNNSLFGNLNIKALWCLSDDYYTADTFDAERRNKVRGFEYDTAEDNPLIKRYRKFDEDCEDCEDRECCEKCGSALCDGSCDGCCECDECGDDCCECGNKSKNEKCNESCFCVSFTDDLPCSFLQIPCDRLGCDYCDCSDLLDDDERYTGIDPDKFVDDPSDEESETDDVDDTVEEDEDDALDTVDTSVDDEDVEDDEDADDTEEDDEESDDEDDDEDDEDEEDDELEDEDDEDEEDDEEEDDEEDEDEEELNESSSPLCIKNIIRDFYKSKPSDNYNVEQRTNMFLQVLSDIISTEKRGIQKDRTSGRGRSLIAHNPKTNPINLNFYELSPIHLRDVARIKCIYQQPSFIGYFMLEPLNHNRITIFSFDYDDMKYIVRTYTMQNQSGSTVVNPTKGEKAYARPLHYDNDDIEISKIDKVYNRDDKLANVFNKKNIICGALIKGSPSTSSAGVCIKNALKALYGSVDPLSNRSETLIQWHLINLILQKSVNKTNFLEAIKEWEVVGYKTGRTSCVCGYENITLGYKIRNKNNGEVIHPVGAKCIKAFVGNDKGNFVRSETSPENIDNGWGQRARNSSIIDYDYDDYRPDTRTQEDKWRDYIRDTHYGTDDFIGDVRQTRWKELRKQGYRD